MSITYEIVVGLLIATTTVSWYMLYRQDREIAALMEHNAELAQAGFDLQAELLELERTLRPNEQRCDYCSGTGVGDIPDSECNECPKCLGSGWVPEVKVRFQPDLPDVEPF